MIDQNLSRPHAHFSEVEHSQALSPCKLSLQEKQLNSVMNETKGRT
jgi:hypothetical protein